MRIVIECSRGLQLEVIVRKHREGQPQYTNEADLTAKQVAALKKASVNALSPKEDTDTSG
jgi:hypothetical protein